MPETDKKIIIELENSGENGEVRFRQDDIKEETLETLGNHLSKITRDANNNPPLRYGSKIVSLQTARGNPAAIEDTDSSVYPLERYTSMIKIGTTEFRNLSDSKLLDIKIRKGKTDDQADPTGEEIINDASEKLGESKIAQSVQQILLDNNKYADGPENKYVNPETAQEENESNVGHAVLQAALGKHSPRKFPDAVSNDTRFEIKNLKNLGLQTLLEASGEYYIPDDTEDFGQVVLSKAATVAPGLARMGIRIPASRFSAAEIASTVNEDFRKESRFPKLAGPEYFSYGNVNNPLVPFNAVSSTHAGVAAVLLATTICELLQMLAEVIGPSESLFKAPSISDIGSGIFSSNKDLPQKTSREARKERLGSYLGKGRKEQPASSVIPATTLFSSDLFGDEFFMLTQTQNNYGDAVDVGCQLFFDAPGGGLLGAIAGAAAASLNTLTGGLTAGLVGESYKKVTDNPSYYSVILRMLVRATADDIGKLIGAGAGLIGSMTGGGNFMESSGIIGPLDVNPQIGLDADPTNLLNTVANLRDSKLMRFMDILANIGDIALMTSYDKTTRESFDSVIDEIEDSFGGDEEEGRINPAALIKKNRLSDKIKGGDGQLAWGSRTLRSLYLLPTSLIQAQDIFSDATATEGAMVSGKDFKLQVEHRLTREDVIRAEQELDACYMPFYFHDLRTNEIIALHAFIENITDNFNAEYGESEGLGRIGKVYAYKNTNRSIGCSFRVVSTNVNDFSEMWYKINRLVMLLYPQYTAGRQLSVTTDSGKQNFIQPFSQLISNSPLIRLRLGDLLKTNFSEFDLSRLFGTGTSNFFPDKTRKINPEALKAYQEETTRIRNRMSQYDFDEGDEFYIKLPESVGPRINKIIVILEGDNNLQIPPGELVVVKSVEESRFAAKVYKIEWKGLEFSVDFTGLPAATYIGLSSQFINFKAWSALREDFTPEELSAIDYENREEISKFLGANEEDEETNPIFKSFRSVAGEGVAGFIKSLSFDWSDAVWETEGLNNRAPMWCKIDIEFTPIHDLNPGLDSNGSMIAPLYNIGSLLKAFKVKRNLEEDERKKAIYSTLKKAAAIPSKKKESGEEGGDDFGGVTPAF